MPDITAAITTYRRNIETLQRAINSIYAQTLKPCEILIIDDNGTEELKSKLDLSKVRYISYEKNRGVSFARNYAISVANGEYIAFLDDDDEWMPNKLEIQAKVLEEYPDSALVFGGGLKLFENGDTAPTWSSTIFKPDPDYDDMLRADYVGSASHPLIRVDILRDLGGFRKMPAVEDYELWIRIAKNGKLRGTDKVLFRKYMPEGEHVSGNHKRVFQGYKIIYETNRKSYESNPRAKERILYNIIRRGIMAKTPAVLPYCFRWLFARISVIGSK